LTSGDRGYSYFDIHLLFLTGTQSKRQGTASGHLCGLQSNILFNKHRGSSMINIFIALCFLLSSLVTSASAGMNEFESCRCKNWLATKGDQKHEVLQKCDQPASQQYGSNRDCREIWLYNFGPNEFMQGVCFDSSGRVKKILSLGHGY